MGKWQPELGGLQHKASPPPYIMNPEEYNSQDIKERTSNLSKVQQGCIVPSARWNLLPLGTPTRRAYTAA